MKTMEERMEQEIETIENDETLTEKQKSDMIREIYKEARGML